jgi:soluble lytic murein transglycosylase-like protein
MRIKIVFVALSTLIALAGYLRVEPQAEVMQEQTTTAEQPTTTAIVEVETIEIVETVAEPAYKLCDIPLDEELQIWVFDYCKDKHINPYLVFAMCERESNYNADAVGDSGNSLGIMQIQPKWHQWRMDKLGLFDWMDATQNIMIGIDILLDLYSKNDDTAWVLMAYNGGVAYANRHYEAGNISEYAEYIMARAEELEQMKGE